MNVSIVTWRIVVCAYCLYMLASVLCFYLNRCPRRRSSVDVFTDAIPRPPWFVGSAMISDKLIGNSSLVLTEL